jgi:glycerophosphoryl diester phosphodiesterase
MMGTEIIAHRGASFDAPENTLAAVQLAWKQNADAVEVDVQFSKDGHIVVIHDDSTRKTAGVRRKVSAQTLGDLKALDAGAWKGKRWGGERIPTLREVFAVVPKGKRLFVEIKCGRECIPSFVSDFRTSGLKCEQVVPIGFSLETMRQLKVALPGLEMCWIVEFKRTWRGGWSPSLKQLIAETKAAGFDGLDVSRKGPVEGQFVRKIHAAGLKLYIWTVDSASTAKGLVAAGIDGITTNKPQWLRERIGATGPKV